MIDQEKKVINSLINTKYYNCFKNGEKSLCLTFYYNYKFGDANLIPNFQVPLSDPEKIILHLNYLLDFYVEQQFKCDIKINDELWVTDLENRDKIVEVFIQKFQYSEYKPKTINITMNVIHCLEDKHLWFINLIKKFNNIGINIKLNFESILIDIVDVKYLFEIKDFLLTYTNLKIKINPNNFVYFTQVFNSLYSIFNKILYLYEEDNVNWTDYKINEYIEFLDMYIDKIYKEFKTDADFLQALFLDEKINLISFNNQSKKSCPFYNSLNILLEDLTINLCPKFQYNDQIIGIYNCTDKIINIEPKNIENIDLIDKENIQCLTCSFNKICKGFCNKESYRYCLNSIEPIRESCENKKVKYAFLFFKLKNLNIINKENFDKISSDINLDYILNLYNQIIQRIGDK